MVADGKLIDADALVAQAQIARFAGKWFDEVIARRSIVLWINSQPDASEPLREELARKDARIAELGRFIARVANAENSLEWETLCVESIALTSPETLKGAQDA